MKKWLLIFSFFFGICSLSIEAQISNDSVELVEQEQPQDYQKTFTKMVFSLMAIIVLIFLTFYLFKRLTSGKNIYYNNQKNIKILEKRVLSPKSVLYLVEIDNEKVLIAESHLEIRRIHNLNK